MAVICRTQQDSFAACRLVQLGRDTAGVAVTLTTGVNAFEGELNLIIFDLQDDQSDITPQPNMISGPHVDEHGRLLRERELVLYDLRTSNRYARIRTRYPAFPNRLFGQGFTTIENQR